jgi:phosphomannomutase
MLYYASGDLGVPGAMITASHNPARYNGIKLCWAGAKPVGIETGLKEIQDLAERSLVPAPSTGTVTGLDLLPGYADHLRKLVDISGIRPLTVAVDAGNGMAGYTVPKVFEGLPITLIPLYFELDGTFPNHEANPIEPENLRDLQRAVIEHHADIGLAFDGDADRCFVVDERGEIVSPSAITALIAARELAHEPGAAIIHNLITSRAVPEIISEHGGVPVRTRVGHSFIKAKMASYAAVFGGEHSGHFYFRDFWFADSGMLAALHVLAALGTSPRPASQLLAEYSRYAASGEINSVVADQAAATAQVKAAYEGRPGVSTDELDGLTVSAATWWFNLRPSNTEPLLRLNAEADTGAAMAAVRDEVLGLVRGTTDRSTVPARGTQRSPGETPDPDGRNPRGTVLARGTTPGTPADKTSQEWRRETLCRLTAGSWTSWRARSATRRCGSTRRPASSSAPAPPAAWPTPFVTTSRCCW